MGVPLLSCEIDIRIGGKYRLEFGQDAASAFAFFGKYIGVIPGARLVWTNDEGEEGLVTTVTFAAKGGQTLPTFYELYPTKEALDEACIGMEIAMPEQFEQLDALLCSVGASANGV